MRLLVVEDEKRIAQNIAKLLKKESYAVDIAYDGKDAIKKITFEEYDLIILDSMLPGVSGIEVLKKVRLSDKAVPILFLTSKSQVPDKLEAFSLGCDDYITKPFDFDILLARIKALLKRRSKVIVPTIQTGDLILDRDKMEVTIASNVIDFSSREYALLEYLALNIDKALGRDTLLTHVWDENADSFTRTVDVHISSLRKKIAKYTEANLIRTIPNKGYMLITV